MHLSLTESDLVVGLEETAYTVDEVDSYQLVCIGVLSGDVDGREITLSYSTTSGTACKSLVQNIHVRGKNQSYNHFNSLNIVNI